MDTKFLLLPIGIYASITYSCFAADEINPFDTATRIERIESLRREGKLEAALAEIENCVKIGCPENSVMEQRAHLAFDKGEHEKAYPLYSKLVALKVSLPLSRARRARVANALKKYDVAIQDLTLLARDNPNSLPIKLFLGEVYSTTKNHKQARKIFTEILAIQPNHSATALQLAKLEFNSGNSASAEKRLTDLSNGTSPEQVVAAKLLFQIKMKSSVAQAGTFIREYLAKNPSQEWAYNQYALLLDEINEPALLKSTLERSIQIPNSYSSLFNLGVIEQRAGNNENAIAHYRAIPKESKIYPLAQDNLAVLIPPTEKTPAESTELAKTQAEEPISIEVVRGDTLQKVSDRAYGTTRRWKEIEALNQDVLKGKTDLVLGMKLRLKELPKVQSRTIGSTKPEVVKIPHNQLIVSE